MAQAQLVHIGTREKGGMHRIFELFWVIDDEGLLGGVDHIGRIAIARSEIQAALTDKALVPFGDARIEGCLGLQREHARTGRCDGIGGGGIATRARAVKDHIVELFKETVIDEIVKIGIDFAVAKP